MKLPSVITEFSMAPAVAQPFHVPAAVLALRHPDGRAESQRHFVFDGAQRPSADAEYKHVLRPVSFSQNVRPVTGHLLRAEVVAFLDRVVVTFVHGGGPGKSLRQVPDELKLL